MDSRKGVTTNFLPAVDKIVAQLQTWIASNSQDAKLPRGVDPMDLIRGTMKVAIPTILNTMRAQVFELMKLPWTKEALSQRTKMPSCILDDLVEIHDLCKKYATSRGLPPCAELDQLRTLPEVAIALRGWLDAKLPGAPAGILGINLSSTPDKQRQAPSPVMHAKPVEEQFQASPLPSVNPVDTGPPGAPGDISQLPSHDTSVLQQQVPPEMGRPGPEEEQFQAIPLPFADLMDAGLLGAPGDISQLPSDDTSVLQQQVSLEMGRLGPEEEHLRASPLPSADLMDAGLLGAPDASGQRPPELSPVMHSDPAEKRHKAKKLVYGVTEKFAKKAKKDSRKMFDDARSYHKRQAYANDLKQSDPDRYARAETYHQHFTQSNSKRRSVDRENEPVPKRQKQIGSGSLLGDTSYYGHSSLLSNGNMLDRPDLLAQSAYNHGMLSPSFQPDYREQTWHGSPPINIVPHGRSQPMSHAYMFARPDLSSHGVYNPGGVSPLFQQNFQSTVPSEHGSQHSANQHPIQSSFTSAPYNSQGLHGRGYDNRQYDYPREPAQSGQWQRVRHESAAYPPPPSNNTGREHGGNQPPR